MMSVRKPSSIAAVLTVFLLIFSGTACMRSSTVLNQPASGALKLERVVVLMRHGVRPPTKSYVIPAGFARDPWPTWGVPPGHLTDHGYKGAVLLGRWDRSSLSRRGLLPATGCQADAFLNIWADTDQRTRKTGRGYAQGFAPDCKIVVGHADGDRNDPLFAPIATGAVPYDPEKAKAAILSSVNNDLGSAAEPLAAEIETLGRILACCGPPLCKASGLPAGCSLADIPNVWNELTPRKRVKFIGPLTVGGSAAESILLEYVDGKPMDDVGWGRASTADLTMLSRIHAAEFRLLARTPYIADRAATPVMRRVLGVFEGEFPARLTVLVGHDTNVAHLGGMLDLHWHVPGYAADDQAVNGGLGFELLRGTDEQRYVRVFYEAQGLKQLRDLTPLDAEHPPYRDYLQQPLCGLEQDPTLCRLDDFTRAVRARMH